LILIFDFDVQFLKIRKIDGFFSKVSENKNQIENIEKKSRIINSINK